MSKAQIYRATKNIRKKGKNIGNFRDCRNVVSFGCCVSCCALSVWVAQVRPYVEPLTISTIFSRAGAWVEAWGSCRDWVLLGCGNISCWSVLNKYRDSEMWDVEENNISKYKKGYGYWICGCITISTYAFLCALPVPVWSKQVPVESLGREAAARGSSSSGSQGLPGRHEWASQAEGRW